MSSGSGPGGLRVLNPCSWPRISQFWRLNRASFGIFLVANLYSEMEPQKSTTRIHAGQCCNHGRTLRAKVTYSSHAKSVWAVSPCASFGPV